MRRAVGLAAVACLALAGCGEATVTVEEQSTSVAPLTKPSKAAAKSSESNSAKASTSASRSAEPTAVMGGPAGEPQENDVPGKQVSEVPQQSFEPTKQDKGYLESLEKGGVKVEGVESQMVGLGNLVCGKADGVNPATVQAVAGQLIEQKRTTKNFDELVKLIESSAKSAYC
ncbi:hypothetical protein FRC0028_02218 [Corynebacterium diphtheriae]|nr:hypothetical protein FRC0028_02218 [Corynebacterium diphtheriae]CAB0715368.1 hypothetical protein FRC0081_02208 [Corynebacterium diphtheriae]CAB0763134.1 hypothetical protein FRC0134_02212 [Corynebacterium diphtheriae]CAB0778826.1 hypothetical protein FRC0174_02211 [Corynebacterium diphtheriae]CAB0919398.1 hypothetical protein FRC0423_02199 [Corynebacterium diphtheriae]